MGVKMTFFGLKQSEDLENWAAHPTKNSQEYHLNPPPPPSWGVHSFMVTILQSVKDYAGITLIIITVSGASGIMLRHTCKFNTHKL